MPLISRHHGASRRLTVYAILFTFVWICKTSPSLRESSNEFNATSSTSPYSSTITNSNDSYTTTNITKGSSQETAFDDLAKVLGMRLLPLHLRNRSPPEYFRHLFKSTSDDDGLHRKPGPYHADEVVGYLDMGGRSQNYYFYNVSGLESDSEFLNADLHLYRFGRRTPSRRFKRSAQFIIFKIYQVTNPLRKQSPFGNRLIDIKRVLATQNSWVVFRIREAVESWVVREGKNNHGVLITAQNGDGSPVNASDILFAQRGLQHDRLQPCIAMYKKMKNRTEESSSVDTELTRAFDSEDPHRYENMYQGMYYYVPPAIPFRANGTTTQQRSSRIKRSTNLDSSSQPPVNREHAARSDRRRRSNSEWPSTAEETAGRNIFCSVHSMRVSFSTMGWDKWIISPTDFDARICLGRCPFPLGQSYYPTNHAVVQSIWKHLNQKNSIGRKLKSPCCVPHTLNALNMLYYDEDFKVVLKSYEKMVVTSCGCK